MRAHLTPQAEIDLEEIGDYIALDNPKRAVSFIREIRQHCERIADGRGCARWFKIACQHVQ
jgi:toxin ParE1/3/4